MSHYSKINIVSEYLTPNGYLFSGYSQNDLPEIFLQQLKKVIDFEFEGEELDMKKFSKFLIKKYKK